MALILSCTTAKKSAGEAGAVSTMKEREAGFSYVYNSVYLSRL